VSERTLFRKLAEARAIGAAWRMDYNQAHPHGALAYQTPAEFAAKRDNTELM